jgi:hypothetical protein
VVTETGICLNFEGWMSEDMMQKIAGIMPPNEENGLDMLCGFDYNEEGANCNCHPWFS